MATLELRHVLKSYGATDVIHGIDLEVPSGDFCVFVGPSGCGKSTLLRMIAGLEDITGGEVAIEGEVVNHITAAQRGLAMVFQSYALYPHMSVRDNLSFGLQNLQMPKAEIDQRVNDAARMLQIDDYLHRKPGQLSGGQRQRVAIGRAVVREPRIFLFDEPLSNLDAELRVAMRGEIADLHRRLGNTMVYVTHDQVEAMTMADKIAVLRAGRLEQFGPPLELFNHPANLFVAGFIGSPKMNFLDGTVNDDGMVVLPGGAEIALPEAKFGARPGENVVLGARPGRIVAGDSEAQLSVHVNGVEQLGNESYLYGVTEGGTDLTVHMPGQTDIRYGDTVPVRIDPGSAYLFDKTSEESLSLPT